MPSAAALDRGDPPRLHGGRARGQCPEAQLRPAHPGRAEPDLLLRPAQCTVSRVPRGQADGNPPRTLRRIPEALVARERLHVGPAGRRGADR